MNTVRAILDAEKEASSLCGEARSLAASRAARIDQDKQALAKRYDELAASAVTAAEEAEHARADAELARISEETQRRIAALERRFDAARETSVDQLFRLVIGEDDGRQ